MRSPSPARIGSVGTFFGNFRDSDWNAEDPVLNVKRPYKNQQYSGTIGGPIVTDRLHYFANYEYDRSPKTSIWNTPYPLFNVSLSGLETKKMGGGRLDYQLASSTRLMFKAHHANHTDPFTTGNNNHPAATDERDRQVDRVPGTGDAGDQQRRGE